MAGLPSPTYLANSVSVSDSEVCLLDQFDEVCSLVREPSHVFIDVGTERMIITSCLDDGKVAVIRGADGTTVGSWPKNAPICFVKAVQAPDCTRLLSTSCGKCTCGCCEKENNESV